MEREKKFLNEEKTIEVFSRSLSHVICVIKINLTSFYRRCPHENTIKRISDILLKQARDSKQCVKTLFLLSYIHDIKKCKCKILQKVDSMVSTK